MSNLNNLISALFPIAHKEEFKHYKNRSRVRGFYPYSSDEELRYLKKHYPSSKLEYVNPSDRVQDSNPATVSLFIVGFVLLFFAFV